MPTLAEVLATSRLHASAVFHAQLGNMAAHSAVYRQASMNMFSEQQLDVAFWQELVDDVVLSAASPAAICKTIREICRRYPLRGRPVALPSGTTFGKGIT